jgi:formyl-CoA transferase
MERREGRASKKKASYKPKISIKRAMFGGSEGRRLRQELTSGISVIPCRKISRVRPPYFMFRRALCSAFTPNNTRKLIGSNAGPFASASRISGALSGLKVVELGQLISGPFASKVLADFGADVIEIEPIAGDPLRKWRLLKDGTSVWWQIQARNKRSISLDLKDAESQCVVRRLALEADVLIENFRPGTMEAWSLDPQTLMDANPRLIVLRISGYGQTGPYRDRPGLGLVAEAMGGLRFLSGEPGRVPVRVGVSIGDTLAALHGVIGILAAVHERGASGRGQVVDVALYEAVFNCMESLLPEFSAFGAVRQPAGSALPGIVPSNAYLCGDGAHVVIAGNGDSIFKRLMAAAGREEVGLDTRFGSNDLRAQHAEYLDGIIGAWTLQLPLQAVLQRLEHFHVPAGRIYTIADIASDPHYLARGMLQQVTTRDSSLVSLPGIVPKLSRTPGGHRHSAPLAVGQDTVAVLKVISLQNVCTHHGFCLRCFCLLFTAGHGDQRLANRRNEAQRRPIWQLTENPFQQQSRRHALVTMACTAEGEACINSCNMRHALLDLFCRQCGWATILVSVKHAAKRTCSVPEISFEHAPERPHHVCQSCGCDVCNVGENRNPSAGGFGGMNKCAPGKQARGAKCARSTMSTRCSTAMPAGKPVPTLPPMRF